MSQQEFILTKTFNAPKEMVFDAFASAEALAQWWGPVEAPIDVLRLDFRPEGIFHYRMKGTHLSYGIFRYKKIERPNNITWINSFADENGAIIKPPFKDFDLPKEILNSITLTEVDGITTLVLKSEPINASESEIDCFNSITESMEQGFGGTFSQLADYLDKIQK
jgi:uncharacterized protein YndB with AHSA1/START domain